MFIEKRKDTLMVIYIFIKNVMVVKMETKLRKELEQKLTEKVTYVENLIEELSDIELKRLSEDYEEY